jgi:hypothetical protein
MAINLRPLLDQLFDAGAENYEASTRRLIWQAGAVLLLLILIWKRL